MKILQLNIWGGRLGKQIIDLLEREQPDVVCFQEATQIPGGHAFLFADLNEIKERTNYPYEFFTAQFGFKHMRRQVKMGLATLSKVPFVDTHAFFTRLEYNDDFEFAMTDVDYNVRALQHVVVEYNGKKINILNHHGHHIPDHKNGDAETVRQCTEIAEYIKKLEGPSVLCGDFNLAPDSESVKILERVLSNPIHDLGVTTTRTTLTHKTEICDYIFVSPELGDVHLKVLDDIASDHKALTITL